MSVLSFTWKGVSSDSHGICVKKLPYVYAAGVRNSVYTIPDRDGLLRIPENAVDECVLLLDCYLPYEQGGTVSPLADIRAWLRGEGWFTQSDIPDRAFYAQITDTIAFQPVLDGFADRIFSVTLYAKPYQYHYPQPSAITIRSSPATVNNVGTAASQPRITLTGSGNITLTVNGNLMEFTGVTTGVVVDSEKMDVFAADGITLANNIASMDAFPVLKAGANTVSYTGNVSSVSILPRWRDI